MVECACVMGIRENAGWRKPRTDVSGADIERKREKKYTVYIVSCSRCKSMKKKKAVQSCFMCVSHTCIVLRKFVYYTRRFKKVYKSIYIYIYIITRPIFSCVPSPTAPAL